MTAPTPLRARPLSPHLQVYRLPMTALMSITHRATGVALVAGTALIAWWLAAAALGEEAYNIAMGYAQTPVGTFILFGWSIALFYHMCNGIRHLIWDMGFLFKLRNAAIANWVVLFATAGLTALTWWYACEMGVR